MTQTIVLPPPLQFIAMHADACFVLSLGMSLLLISLLYRTVGRVRTWQFWRQLQVGALLAAACSFILIASRLGSQTLNTWDITFSATLRNNASPLLVTMLRHLTHLGDGITLTAIAVCLSTILSVTGHLRLAAATVFAIAGNTLLNNLLKDYFQRLRPQYAELSTWSFPSGHSSGSMVAYGIIVYLTARLLPPKYCLPVLLLMATAIFVTGSSRIFLGVHYTTDVVAGFATGLCWLMLTFLIAEATPRH